MSSLLVVKAKYGETLRRFNVYLDGNGSLNFDMNGMRAKIIKLFNLSPDTDFSLAYLDEDNDMVALVDDNDLVDVVRQNLVPLRITVKVTSSGARIFDKKSSGASTPMSSAQIPSPPPYQLNSGINDVLRSVPEPLLSALIKLPYELASKAASSAPGFLPDPFNALLKESHNLVSQAASSGAIPSELMKCLEKLAMSYQEPSKPQDDVGSSTKGDDSGNSDGVNVPNATKDPIAPQNLKIPVGSPTVSDSTSGTRGVATSIRLDNVSTSKDSNVSGLSQDKGKKLQNEYGSMPAGKSLANDTSASKSLVDSSMRPHVQPPHTLKNASVSPDDKPEPFAIGGDNDQKKNLNSMGHSFAGVLSLRNGCPPCSNTGSDINRRFNNALKIQRGNSHNSMGRTFHRGVRCDGCGMYPITGSRYKSLVKVNYDLCSICYAEMGNDGEYTRMDHPVSHRSPRFYKESYNPNWNPRFGRALPHGWHGVDMRSLGQKLDSCFIHDVNVFDGTLMAPKTTFTKIWRMRNNGGMVWPRGTQLVWIGGDQLTASLSVDVEIPFDGCPTGMEIDVAVDCIAPETPGQYISYFRLAVPSGYKFGQCVWVLIRVDGSSQNPFSTGPNSWNLNLLPEESETKASIIDINEKPVDVNHPEFISDLGAELVKPMVDGTTGNGEELNLNRESGNGNVTPQNPEAVSYPLIDLSSAPSDPLSVINTPEPYEVVNDRNAVERSLLRELDDMGFKQSDLNKEILRMNEYNLERSVEDLCGFSEWDPLLEELEEMGFCDKQMNTRLLVKNGGSIKRVVMDLIAGEKKVQ
ncbi:hypothetical protein Sjap_023495 [Stephania japonica]|uniref:ZZ-type domain-containing protein n=1 Tax=Stephania japonica TaxID=461633 RepID=A0AAP0EGX5_9MAGN